MDGRTSRSGVLYFHVFTLVIPVVIKRVSTSVSHRGSSAMQVLSRARVPHVPRSTCVPCLASEMHVASPESHAFDDPVLGASYRASMQEV